MVHVTSVQGGFLPSNAFAVHSHSAASPSKNVPPPLVLPLKIGRTISNASTLTPVSRYGRVSTFSHPPGFTPTTSLVGSITGSISSIPVTSPVHSIGGGYVSSMGTYPPGLGYTPVGSLISNRGSLLQTPTAARTSTVNGSVTSPMGFGNLPVFGATTSVRSDTGVPMQKQASIVEHADEDKTDQGNLEENDGSQMQFSRELLLFYRKEASENESPLEAGFTVPGVLRTEPAPKQSHTKHKQPQQPANQVVSHQQLAVSNQAEATKPVAKAQHNYLTTQYQQPYYQQYQYQAHNQAQHYVYVQDQQVAHRRPKQVTTIAAKTKPSSARNMPL